MKSILKKTLQNMKRTPRKRLWRAGYNVRRKWIWRVFLRASKLDPDMMSVDDVIRIAVDLDDYLIDLYQEVANCTESKEIKEIFVKLMEKENREKYTLVRQAMRLSDI